MAQMLLRVHMMQQANTPVMSWTPALAVILIAMLMVTPYCYSNQKSGGSDSSVSSSSSYNSNGTSVTGTYGTLTIGADGSYTYAAVNPQLMILTPVTQWLTALSTPSPMEQLQLPLLLQSQFWVSTIPQQQ